MHETYPAIVEQAKEEGAEIYWGDETGINNQAYHVKGYSPKGKAPEIASFSKIENKHDFSNHKGAQEEYAQPVSGEAGTPAAEEEETPMRLHPACLRPKVIFLNQ